MLSELTVFLRSPPVNLFLLLDADAGRTIALIRIKRSRLASFSVYCSFCLNRSSASSVIVLALDSVIEGETICCNFKDSASSVSFLLMQKKESSSTRKSKPPSIAVIMIAARPMWNFMTCLTCSQVLV